MTNLFSVEDETWLDELLLDEKPSVPCKHNFVTRVVQDGDNLFQPERWEMLDNLDTNYGHDHVAAIRPRYVFCAICEMKGSEV